MLIALAISPVTAPFSALPLVDLLADSPFQNDHSSLKTAKDLSDFDFITGTLSLSNLAFFSPAHVSALPVNFHPLRPLVLRI